MSFIEEHIRTLVHLRRRLHKDNMLALCLGAGVSADLKFPMWHQLVQDIAAHPDVGAATLAEHQEGLAVQAQLLFQRFRQKKAQAAERESGSPANANRLFVSQWLRVVHQCLYKGAITDDAGLRAHPYLWELLPLIKKSSMTINYNFDDSVERLLYLHNEQSDPNADEREFEVVWKPSVQFRRKHGVIYHPNGFLPFHMSDGFSEDIVFLEQEFADQLIDVADGHYASLLNHFSKQTVVFVGLSLSDTSLKHVLRTSARNNPGHFHYLIRWCNDGKKPDAEAQKNLIEANFSLYNVVTLFLTTDEIHEFSRLLVANEEAFNAACEHGIKPLRRKYRYYLTGPVGAGKSTMLDYIRCLNTFDEWVDRKHPLLPVPQEDLTNAQRADVDEWINQQFRKKNRRLTDVGQSISLVDRSPIDPLYFVPDATAKRKRANELIQWMAPGDGGVDRIASGQLIMLTCKPVVLEPRLLAREKHYSQERLESHIAAVERVWSGVPNITRIDTSFLTISEVVKRVLAVILFEPYQETSFQEICEAAAATA